MGAARELRRVMNELDQHGWSLAVSAFASRIDSGRIEHLLAGCSAIGRRIGDQAPDI